LPRIDRLAVGRPVSSVFPLSPWGNHLDKNTYHDSFLAPTQLRHLPVRSLGRGWGGRGLSSIPRPHAKLPLSNQPWSFFPDLLIIVLRRLCFCPFSFAPFAYVVLRRHRIGPPFSNAARHSYVPSTAPSLGLTVSMLFCS